MVAFTAPHYASAQAGLTVLENGGTAIEAMVAAAASIAVEYPHMNGLGGDGFWLISEPGKVPLVIDACGDAAARADIQFYPGLNAIPSRGPMAALTMAGAVAGWQRALKISEDWQSPIPLTELLSFAIGQSKWGIEVTQSLSDASFKTFDALSSSPHFAPFLIKGQPLKKGKILKLGALSSTLQHLATVGLDDFYRGDLAKQLAQELENAGSPLRLEDFNHFQTATPELLSVETSRAKLFNLGAPTQGVASLLILALFDRVCNKVRNETDFVHLLIECTKQAFLVRNDRVTDPGRVDGSLQNTLTDAKLDALAANIQLESALPWPHMAKTGDTVWMGACDNAGRMVSYIQSLYWEYGSGVVLPGSGIVWNNRGTAFDLSPTSLNFLEPGRKPFHTLNPAYAELHDGRRMVYGTMGGEGQPQTQAAVFARFIYQQMPLEKAISKGRWLLGRTWGDQSHNLKVEADLADELAQGLIQRGHDTVVVEACNELMGHAGAIVTDASGNTQAASDPRSDGKAFVVAGTGQA